VPDPKIIAIIAAMSDLEPSHIERVFMFGDNGSHDRLTEFFDKYWETTNGNRLMAGIRAERTLDHLLSYKKPVPYSALFHEEDSEKFKNRTVEIEDMKQKLHFFLRNSVKERIDFLYKLMSQECSYEHWEDPSPTFFAPFDFDLCAYTKKYFIPISNDYEDEVRQLFDDFVKSSKYHEPLTEDLLDLKNIDHLTQMREFCQNLINSSGYSSRWLFFEIIRKGYDKMTAIRLVYKGKSPLKSDDPNYGPPENFGYPYETLKKAAGRFGEKLKEKINDDAGYTDIIHRLPAKNKPNILKP